VAESIPDETHYENLYKICANIIHPYDSDYADFLKDLFDIRFQRKNIQGCVEILRLILRNQYQNLPRYYSQIGITEMVAAKNCTIINLLDEAESHSKNSEEIFRIAFGPDHPLVSKSKQMQLEIQYKKQFCIKDESVASCTKKKQH